MDSPILDIATNIKDSLAKQLGEQWDRLSQTDKDLISAIAYDAAELQATALATSSDDAAGQAKLVAEKRQIDAQLANIASMNASEAQTAFWATFHTVAGGLMTIAIGAVKAAV